jgi:catechol 2,3-dioxygenase-like lactoylglutathione lyase family enzyme
MAKKKQDDPEASEKAEKKKADKADKKKADKKAEKRAAKEKRKESKKKRSTGLELNHVMVYSTDLTRALAFYTGALGFDVIERYGDEYARLVSPGGSGTIGLHALEPGQQMSAPTEGLRIYFEVKGLDELCASLVEKGVPIEKMPADMPWGWRHAYLRDPDGHMISLYWAGKKRFRPTQM